MIHRIDESVPMNELPTWLQELWELDSALARRAEKHYLELKQVKNIAYEPVLAVVDSAKKWWDNLTDSEQVDIEKKTFGDGYIYEDNGLDFTDSDIVKMYNNR